MPVAPTPKSWTDYTDYATAAVLNQEMRDIFNFLLAKPRCTLRRVAAQSIPEGTANRVDVAWDTEDVDTASMWSNASPTQIITQYPGRYSVSVIGNFMVNATGIRAMYCTVNGGTEYTMAVVAAASSGANTIVSAFFEIPRVFSAGEYITIRMGQSSGSALNSAQTYATVRWEGK